MKKALFIITALLVNASCFAQLVLDTSIIVRENGIQIAKPWAAGLDCPMYNSMDLNGDNVKDLVVFDHKTNRISTFLNNNVSGSVSYHYAPEYAQYFPVLHDWIKLYDYNCDGYEDIFTHGNGTIACWKNNGTNPISFTFITPQINSYYHFGPTFMSVNIFVSSINVPSFTDMDGDGDMDILSFPLGASYVEYHQNYSMDSTGLCGGFRFYNMRQCWGYFTLLGDANHAFLPPGAITSGNCPAYPATVPRFAASSTIADDTLRHAGNILEAIDIDADGDKDLLTGDIVGTSVLLVVNGGVADSAYAVAQDSIFPSYDVPAIMEMVAAPYIVDVDNDNKKDMIVANFNADYFQGSGENYYTSIYYKNVSPNNAYTFQRVKNTFLTEEMIDVGSGAHPTFLDVDADGLLDMVIGSDFWYYTGGARKGQLTYYRNTGTAANPEFELVDRDFASVSDSTYFGIYPTFGDIDGDGDMDMLLGNINASVSLYRNTAGAGNPVNFVAENPQYQNISVGTFGQQSAPVLYDLNKDSLLDLIIGKRVGMLYYYQNTGTSTNPVFTLITDSLGNVDVHDATSLLGYAAPVFFEIGGVTQLLVGSFSGHIYHYDNIDGNLSGTFNIVDSSYEDIFEPTNAVPAIADLNNDGFMDVVVGNAAGGLRYYSKLTIDVASHDPDPGFICFPNPASGIINLEFDNLSRNRRNINVNDVLGRTVLQTSSFNKRTQLDVSTLQPGSYIITVDDNGKRITQKIIIQ